MTDSTWGSWVKRLEQAKREAETEGNPAIVADLEALIRRQGGATNPPKPSPLGPTLTGLLRAALLDPQRRALLAAELRLYGYALVGREEIEEVREALAPFEGGDEEAEEALGEVLGALTRWAEGEE